MIRQSVQILHVLNKLNKTITSLQETRLSNIVECSDCLRKGSRLCPPDAAMFDLVPAQQHQNIPNSFNGDYPVPILSDRPFSTKI